MGFDYDEKSGESFSWLYKWVLINWIWSNQEILEQIREIRTL